MHVLSMRPGAALGLLDDDICSIALLHPRWTLADGDVRTLGSGKASAQQEHADRRPGRLFVQPLFPLHRPHPAVLGLLLYPGLRLSGRRPPCLRLGAALQPVSVGWLSIRRRHGLVGYVPHFVPLGLDRPRNRIFSSPRGEESPMTSYDPL